MIFLYLLFRWCDVVLDVLFLMIFGLVVFGSFCGWSVVFDVFLCGFFLGCFYIALLVMGFFELGIVVFGVCCWVYLCFVFVDSMMVVLLLGVCLVFVFWLVFGWICLGDVCFILFGLRSWFWGIYLVFLLICFFFVWLVIVVLLFDGLELLFDGGLCFVGDCVWVCWL